MTEKYRNILMEEVTRLTGVVSTKLTTTLSSLKMVDIKGIIAVARGGLVPARFLADHLFPFTGLLPIYLLDVSYYPPGYQAHFDCPPRCSTEFNFSQVKTLFPKGTRLLIVDDILDTGVTCRTIHDELGNDYNCMYAFLYIRTPVSKHLRGNISIFYGQGVSTDEWVIFPWDTFEHMGRGI